jgi:NDP-sugar pyrophosphorylase family protein
MIPALVLTAGLGTRLRPLSLVRAKPAVPVAGQALVARVLRQLHVAGIDDAVLNLHHLPHTITREIGDGSDLGIRVRYSWEMPILGSAGGPRQALPLLAAPTFLIANGDTLTDVDVSALISTHRRSGALVTMAVTQNTEPEKYRSVIVAADGAVTGFSARGSSKASYHFPVRVGGRGVPLPARLAPWVDSRAYLSGRISRHWHAERLPAHITAARGPGGRCAPAWRVRASRSNGER